MHISASTFTRGMTQWGIFTNLFTTEEYWYIHIHTPWLLVNMNATTDKWFSASLWTHKGYRQFNRKSPR